MNRYACHARNFLLVEEGCDEQFIYKNMPKKNKMPFDAQEEAQKWAPLSAIAQQAFDFWNTFLDLRAGAANDQLLSPSQVNNFYTIIRAVSWVESRHGTGTGNQPARDPMQCGNPGDSWWQELTGQSTAQDRFVGGPNAGNYDASKLPGAVQGIATFSPKAKLTLLQDQTAGHNDAAFGMIMSFNWAVPILIQKTNTKPNIQGGKSYQCGDVSRARLTGGAVNYNGGGDPNYGQEISDTIDIIGWPSQTLKQARQKQNKKLLKPTLRKSAGKNKR